MDSVTVNGMESHRQGSKFPHVQPMDTIQHDGSKLSTKRSYADETIYPPKKRALYEHKKLNGIVDYSGQQKFLANEDSAILEDKYENFHKNEIVAMKIKLDVGHSEAFSRPRSDSLHSLQSLSSDHSESVSSTSREPSPFTIHSLYDNRRTPERNPIVALEGLKCDISKPLFPPSSESDNSMVDSEGHNSPDASPDSSYYADRHKSGTTKHVDDILKQVRRSFVTGNMNGELESHEHCPKGTSVSKHAPKNTNTLSSSSSSSSSSSTFQTEDNIPTYSNRDYAAFPQAHIPNVNISNRKDANKQCTSPELTFNNNNVRTTSLGQEIDNHDLKSASPGSAFDNSYMGPMVSLLNKFNMETVTGESNLKRESSGEQTFNNGLKELGSFDSKSSESFRIQFVHEDIKKVYTCEVCNKEFKQSGHLNSHMKSHDSKNYKCRICRVVFLSGDKLQSHMKSDHAGGNAYKCEHCSREFSQYNNLRRHLRVHREKIYKCKLCEREFNEEFYLTMHMGTHTGNRVYSCGVCNIGFSTSHDLKIHVKTHSPSELHTCEVCEKSFSKACVLRQHKKGHSGERPHKCEKCPKTFIHRHHLTMHMRSHVESKPYTCDICQKEFYQSSHLYKHMRLHEEDEKENGTIAGNVEFKENENVGAHNIVRSKLKTLNAAETNAMQKSRSGPKQMRKSKSQTVQPHSPNPLQTNTEARPAISQSFGFQRIGGNPNVPHLPPAGLPSMVPNGGHGSYGSYYPPGYNGAMFASSFGAPHDYNNLYRAAYTAQVQAYYNRMYMMNYLSQNSMLQQTSNVNQASLLKGQTEVGHLEVKQGQCGTGILEHQGFKDHKQESYEIGEINNAYSQQRKQRNENEGVDTVTDGDFTELEAETKQDNADGTELVRNGEDMTRAEVAQELVKLSTGIHEGRSPPRSCENGNLTDHQTDIENPLCTSSRDVLAERHAENVLESETYSQNVFLQTEPKAISIQMADSYGFEGEMQGTNPETNVETTSPGQNMPYLVNQSKGINFTRCINAIIDTTFRESIGGSDKHVGRELLSTNTVGYKEFELEMNKRSIVDNETLPAKDDVNVKATKPTSLMFESASRSGTHSVNGVSSSVTHSDKFVSKLVTPFESVPSAKNYSKADRYGILTSPYQNSSALNLSTKKVNEYYCDSERDSNQPTDLSRKHTYRSTYNETKTQSLKPTHTGTSIPVSAYLRNLTPYSSHLTDTADGYRKNEHFLNMYSNFQYPGSHLPQQSSFVPTFSENRTNYAKDLRKFVKDSPKKRHVSSHEVESNLSKLSNKCPEVDFRSRHWSEQNSSRSFVEKQSSQLENEHPKEKDIGWRMEEYQHLAKIGTKLGPKENPCDEHENRASDQMVKYGTENRHFSVLDDDRAKDFKQNLMEGPMSENRSNIIGSEYKRTGSFSAHSMSAILSDLREVPSSINSGNATLSQSRETTLSQSRETTLLQTLSQARETTLTDCEILIARNEIPKTDFKSVTVETDCIDIANIADEKVKEFVNNDNSKKNEDSGDKMNEIVETQSESNDLKNLRQKIEEVTSKIRRESERNGYVENVEDADDKSTEMRSEEIKLRMKKSKVEHSQKNESVADEIESTMEVDDSDDSLEENRLEIDLDETSQGVQVIVTFKDDGLHAEEEDDDDDIETGKDKENRNYENENNDGTNGEISEIRNAEIDEDLNVDEGSREKNYETDDERTVEVECKMSSENSESRTKENEKIDSYNAKNPHKADARDSLTDKNEKNHENVNEVTKKVAELTSKKQLNHKKLEKEENEMALDLRQERNKSRGSESVISCHGKDSKKYGNTKTESWNKSEQNANDMTLKNLNENWKENNAYSISENEEYLENEKLKTDVNLTCRICWEKYDNLQALEQHQVEHVQKLGTRNQCQYCEKSFTRPFDLQCHLLNHRNYFGENTESDNFLKSVSKSTAQKESRGHVENRMLTPISTKSRSNSLGTNKSKDRFICDFCEETFNQSNFLKDHILTHTGDKPFKCAVCSRGFTHKHNLNRHKMSHNAKAYECTVCGRTFKESFYLQMHMKVHLEEKNRRCEICGLHVPKSEIWKHTSFHLGNIADNPTYEQIGHRVKEILRDQNSKKGSTKDLNLDIISEQISKFSKSNGSLEQLAGLMRLTKSIVGKCDLENSEQLTTLKSENIENMNIHSNRNMNGHTDGQNMLKDAFKVKNVENENQKFAVDSDLHLNALEAETQKTVEHLQKKDTSNSRHECPICHQIFKTKREFGNHLGIHNGTRTHICQTCGKGFKKSCILRTHEKIHSGQKPFTCRDCNASFLHYHHLQVHAKVHGGDGPDEVKGEVTVS